MFGKILGKKDSDNKTSSKEELDLIDTISTMNLTEMRVYVNNKMSKYESNEDGIIEVMKRLISKNENTMQRYLEVDDMDVKVKKAFELVLIISKHKKITVVAVELIQKFLELYADIIFKYDTQNKEIYSLKLKKALSQAISNINKTSELRRKMNILEK